MFKDYLKDISWDFLSKLLILIFLFLQIVRWAILPQFMDIYYHLLTAWGFIQAGGYSGWDFWQFAPAGRVHIYPPLFHLVLSGFIKLGVSQVFLAKICEAGLPWALLLLTWRFMRKNYGPRLAFFVSLAFFTSFSFYLSLLNHIPATLAFILGVLSLGELLKHKFTRSAILLGLTFYTHIGVSFYLLAVFILYCLFAPERKKDILRLILFAVILASPIIIKEVSALKSVTTFGFSLNEKYLIQIKVLEFLLAIYGLFLVFKSRDKYNLFLSLGLGNLVFVIYPYRFFSAEGYFAVLLLAALALDHLYQRLNRKYVFILGCVLLVLLSPTLSMVDKISDNQRKVKVKFFDSAFMGMLFARGESLWHPQEYISAAKIVKDHSADKDIVFSSLNLTGLTISSLAGRASANALLPEIGPSGELNPFISSKILVFTALDNNEEVEKVVSILKLSKIGENKFFKIYENPNCNTDVNPNKASVPFWLIISISGVLILLYKYIKII
jgi:hypothetical protein